MSTTPRTDALMARYSGEHLIHDAEWVELYQLARTLEQENAKMRGLLHECKQAFLGYPQEVRRTPLDLLRDLNSVLQMRLEK